MISRKLTDRLLQLTTYFPVVAVTGPRQAGKTTLCRATFPDKPYVSLGVDAGVSHNTAKSWLPILEGWYKEVIVCMPSRSNLQPRQCLIFLGDLNRLLKESRQPASPCVSIMWWSMEARHRSNAPPHNFSAGRTWARFCIRRYRSNRAGKFLFMNNEKLR